MKLILNILFLFLSYYSLSQDLPSVCGNTLEKYWVNGFNGSSIFNWEITDPNNIIVSDEYYSIIGNGDTIEINWNNDLIGGIYTIKVTEHSEFGCTGEPYYQNIVLNTNDIFVPFDNVIDMLDVCYGEIANIYPGDFISYLWEDGSTNNTFYTSEEGTYKVRLIDDNYNCSFNNITLNINDLPFVNIGNDTTIYYNEYLVLDAYDNNINSYNWSTGDITSSITIFNNYNINYKDIIWVNVIDDNGCQNSDSIYISFFNEFSNLRIPKAFTPNNDNINDYWVFPAPNNDNIIYSFDNIDVVVYNRWGGLVWEYNGNNPKWDGKSINGKQLPMDSYHYIIKFKINGNVYLYKGSVTIII